MQICDYSQCTGCGMCSNLCPQNAISMIEGKHGFVYPNIDSTKCVECKLCIKRCPANHNKIRDCTVTQTYAAWNKNEGQRKNSSSGGSCTLLENAVFEMGGMAVGVKWDSQFVAQFSVALNSRQSQSFRGSKYVQSNTDDIYKNVKTNLEDKKPVLFVGTPCQVAALKSFLGKEYDELFCVDFVCHGVPSYDCFQKYLHEVSKEHDGKKITDVRFRYKSPYWDYCSVRIDFEDKSFYQKYTVDDSYFTLFNIGYTLRESCHNCQYTSLHREGDITLADYWGYTPSCFKMRNYNKGCSLIVVNTEKGKGLFNKIKEALNYEPTTLESAIRTNKSFSEPFVLPNDKLTCFWNDYENGESIGILCKKYVPYPFRLPSLLFLRRLRNRYYWVFKK